MYVIAQIQSIYKKIDELGPFDVVFIDELHLWSDEDGTMYQRAIDDLRRLNPNVRLVGLSATPFRMKQGLCYGEGAPFEACVEHVTMRELIDAGFLTPIIGKNMDLAFDASALHMRGGDFIQSELEPFMMDTIKVKSATAEITKLCHDRRKVLIFSSGNKHSQMIVDELNALGQSAEWVSGEHNASERADVLKRHKDGYFKYLVNCAILTTGYDDPGIDAIGMLRPTRSPGLLLQCAGRGLRRSPGKESCLFLDYGGALEYFGPLDLIENTIMAKRKAKDIGAAPVKTCPQCNAVIHASRMTCDCGFTFTKTLNHHEKASGAAVMSGINDHAVQRTSYSIQAGKDGAAPTLRVTYWKGMFDELAREFISLDKQASDGARAHGLAWLGRTPMKESGGRTLMIRGREIVGKLNGNEVVINTILELLPWCVCLVSPTSVTAAPNPQKPKYLRIHGRRFE